MAVLTNTASAPISMAFGHVRRRAKPSRQRYRHLGLANDDLDLEPGQHPLIGADGRTKGHDGNRPRVLKAQGQNRIGMI